jgi:hypothetical protein
MIALIFAISDPPHSAFAATTGVEWLPLPRNVWAHNGRERNRKKREDHDIHTLQNKQRQTELPGLRERNKVNETPYQRTTFDPAERTIREQSSAGFFPLET